MQTIRVRFTDFWHPDTADALRKNELFKLLSTRYRLELSDEPDFLIYSVFGSDFLRYSCVRIFFTGENVRPNYGECDYAFSFDDDDERNFRLPLYSLCKEFDLAFRPRDVDAVLREDRGFCSFVYSNAGATTRIEFFKDLSQYKPVASGGPVLNNVGNIGRAIEDKLAFGRKFKFAIAFENASHPGYTTEKLLQAFISDAVPIYWGNPLVARDFNPRAFINCHDFDGFDEVIEHVKRVDQDEERYRQYLSEPCFVGNRPNPYVDRDKILERFDQILRADGVVPVARTWGGRWHAFKRKRYVAGVRRRLTRLTGGLGS